MKFKPRQNAFCLKLVLTGDSGFALLSLQEAVFVFHYVNSRPCYVQDMTLTEKSKGRYCYFVDYEKTAVQGKYI